MRQSVRLAVSTLGAVGMLACAGSNPSRATLERDVVRLIQEEFGGTEACIRPAIAPSTDSDLLIQRSLLRRERQSGETISAAGTNAFGNATACGDE